MRHSAADLATRASVSAQTGNRLLDALVRRRPTLRTGLELVHRAAGVEVQAPQTRITHVHFPLDGVMSAQVRLSDGRCSEAMAFGDDGMIGAPVWLGLDESPYRVQQQLAGHAWRIRSGAFCDEVDDDTSIRLLLQRFVAHGLYMASQNIACCQHHAVEQRLCRWILTLADHLHANTVAVTQGALADMIGARRQSVSESVVRLQRTDCIGHRRGRLDIADRRALEARSCECHRLLRRHFRLTLGTLL